MTLPRSLDSRAAASARAADPALPYLDVRSSAEFAAGHPPGAWNVPLAEFDPARGMTPNPRFLEIVRALLPKAGAVIVGCASGGRSAQAQALMLADGYVEVANMTGGFQGGMGPAGPVPGWASSGLPVAKDGRTYAELLKSRGL